VKNLAFDCGGTSGMLQDWYDLPSFLDIPEKLAIVSLITGWWYDPADEGRLQISCRTRDNPIKLRS